MIKFSFTPKSQKMEMDILKSIVSKYTVMSVYKYVNDKYVMYPNDVRFFDKETEFCRGISEILDNIYKYSESMEVKVNFENMYIAAFVYENDIFNIYKFEIEDFSNLDDDDIII